ncbi:nickel ABC transporter permease [Fusibacter ferrireducens]|uniref:Nickel import system permease protein NikB n=1 Tax=Fusibacter ferrireducens TaxID=2785058 RepID=A0ABR9ZQD1_9FIRM|nr:nickel ABC transporter permease [Fusibacter ferrireducens]MBF4692191.1 ABC transporter permease [Fusibacter ferrireducens]
MSRYILKRIFHMIPVMFGVSLIIFTLMFFIPGDPARQILGDKATEASISELRAELGLDKPFVVQYVNYIEGVLTGDFGISYTTKQPVSAELFARFPTTLLFAIISILVACIIGIPLGIISATRQYSFIDNISTTLTLLGMSIPSFWLGLMLMLLFSLHLGWFPATGFYGPKYWVLPSVTIGVTSAAFITRMTRSSMLEVIRQDYIRTARSKGQTEFKIITKHALKNAMIPVVTTIGLIFGASLGGQIITEQVFSIPGLGKLMIDAISQRNYPVVEGGVLLIAFSFTVINLLVDLIYAYIDPRIKSQFVIEKKKKESTALKGM